MIDVTKQAKAIVWIALTEDEQNDCLRLSGNILCKAINFAWEHYM